MTLLGVPESQEELGLNPASRQPGQASLQDTPSGGAPGGATELLPAPQGPQRATQPQPRRLIRECTLTTSAPVELN